MFDGVETPPLFRSDLWDWKENWIFFYEEKNAGKIRINFIERRTTTSLLGRAAVGASGVRQRRREKNKNKNNNNNKKKMVRGNAKKLAQEKNAKKQAEKTTAKSNLGKPNQSLQMKCSVCMAQMKNAKQMRDHFESKHPKLPLPKECEE